MILSKQTYLDLLHAPAEVLSQSYEHLESALIEAPYCQGLRMLLLKKHKYDDSPRLTDYVALAASYAPDRHQLYKWLHTQEAKVVQMPQPESTENLLKALPKVEIPVSSPSDFTENTTMPDFYTTNNEEEDDDSLLEQPKAPDTGAFDSWLQQFHPPRIGGTDLPQMPKAENTSRPKPVNLQSKVERVFNPVDLPSFDIQMEKAAQLIETIIQDGAETTDFAHVNVLAEKSLVESDSLASETLAEILVRQGKIDKAIKMFQTLSLRNPEKSTYFAARIKQLQK